MRTLFLFLVLILCGCLECLSQFGPQQVIDNNAFLVGTVYAADLDGDNDIDVLSASRGDDRLEWYENLDGLGQAWTRRPIASLDQTDWVRAADLDGDSDIDVLALTGASDIIVWYENLDGQGNFGPEIVISNEVMLPQEAIAVDLDGDLDFDVVSASRDDNKIAWYENEDGNGTFGSQQVISTNAFTTFSVYAADIDGDLDMDVMATSAGDKRLYWYENVDGLGNFAPKRVITETSNFGGFVSIFAGDLDGDNDIDVLSAEFGGNRLAWYQNLNGLGSFGTQKVIDDELIKPRTVYAADLDNDDDLDVVAPSAQSSGGANSLIVWYENMDGAGTFGDRQIIVGNLTLANSAFAADLNGDSYNDVLSSSQNDDTISWYANQALGIIDHESSSDMVIYPNPTTGILNINTSSDEILRVTIYSIIGNEIESQDLSLSDLNLTHLPDGFYLLKLYGKVGAYTARVLKHTK